MKYQKKGRNAGGRIVSSVVKPQGLNQEKGWSRKQDLLRDSTSQTMVLMSRGKRKQNKKRLLTESKWGVTVVERGDDA